MDSMLGDPIQSPSTRESEQAFGRTSQKDVDASLDYLHGESELLVSDIVQEKCQQIQRQLEEERTVLTQKVEQVVQELHHRTQEFQRQVLRRQNEGERARRTAEEQLAEVSDQLCEAREQCKQQQGQLLEERRRSEQLQREVEAGLQRQTEAEQARLETEAQLLSTAACGRIYRCRWWLANKRLCEASEQCKQLQRGAETAKGLLQEQCRRTKQLERMVEAFVLQAQVGLDRLEMNASQTMERKVKSVAPWSALFVEEKLGPSEEADGLLDLDLSELADWPSFCGLERWEPGELDVTESAELDPGMRFELGELPMSQQLKGAEEQRQARLLGDPPQPQELQHLPLGTSHSLEGEPQLPQTGRQSPHGKSQPLHALHDLPQPLQQPGRVPPDAPRLPEAELQLQQEQPVLPPQGPLGEPWDRQGQVEPRPGGGPAEPEDANAELLDGVWVWCAHRPLSEPLLDSLALYENPSTQASTVGWVFLEQPFLAKPVQKGWLKAVLKDGCLEHSRTNTKVAVRREETPSRDHFAGDAVMSLQAIDHLHADGLPSHKDNNGQFFWKVLSPDSPLLETPPLPWPRKPAPHVKRLPSGILVLGREEDGNGVNLDNWEGGEPLYLECWGPCGEQLLARASGPLEILGNPMVAPKSDEHMSLTRIKGIAQMALQRWLHVDGHALEKGLMVKELPTSHNRPERFWKVSVPELSISYTLVWDRVSAEEQDLPSLLCQAHRARASSARVLIVKHGLGPQRRFAIPDWHLEEVLPEEVFREETLSERMGALVAQVHKEVGTTWFDKWRDLMCKFLPPWAQSLDDDRSHFWSHACTPGAFMGLDERRLREWACRADFKPRSRAGRRIVTCHGGDVDVTATNRPQVRDTRCSCVTWAAADLLGLAVSLGYGPSNEEPCCEAFRSYLSAWGDLDGLSPSEAREVVEETLEDVLDYRKVRQSLQEIRDEASSSLPAEGGGGGGVAGGGGEGGGTSLGGVIQEGARGGGTTGAGPIRPAQAGSTPSMPAWDHSPRLRLEALGQLRFWRVRAQQDFFDPQALGLLTRPVRPLVPISFLPLRRIENEPFHQRVVFGSEVPDSPGFLRVIFPGSRACYLDRDPKGQSGIVVEPMEDAAVQQLAGTDPGLVATVDMTWAQRQATDAEHNGISQKTVPKWWQVTAATGVPVRDAPDLHASMMCGGMLRLRPNDIVLAEQLNGRIDWVELIHPTHTPNNNSHMYVCITNPSQDPPELLRVLEGPGGLRQVLCSWYSIERTAEKLLEEAALTFPGDVESIASLNADLGWLMEQKKTNGRSGRQETLKLRFSRKATTWYFLHFESAKGQPWIPAIMDRERRATAQEVFAADSFSPKPFREGPGWRLEEDAGEDLYQRMLGMPPTLDLAMVQKLARRIAQKDLRLPTGWFDDYRRLYRSLVHELRDVPKGSHVWWSMSSEDRFQSIDPDKRAHWAAWQFEPVSQASQRLVTCHGDLHFLARSNILIKGDDLFFIDHESSCVTWAVEDLAAAIQPFCAATYPKATRREFVWAYLGEVDARAPTKTEVDELLFDLQCYRITGKLFLKTTYPNAEMMEEVYRIARKRNTDQALQLYEMIVESGLTTATRWYMDSLSYRPPPVNITR